MRPEQRIEARLRRLLFLEGAEVAPKLIHTTSAGWPDISVYGPRATHFLIETKQPGERLRALQRKRVRRLRNLGFKVYVVDNSEEGLAIYRRECRRAASRLPA